MQVSRRKEIVSSCSVSSKGVYLRIPPVRRRRNSSVYNFEVRFTLFGMQNGRMVTIYNVQIPTLCYFFTIPVCCLDVSVQETALCAQSTAVQYLSSSPFKSTCVTCRGYYTPPLPSAQTQSPKREFKRRFAGYCRWGSQSCCW